MARSLYSRLHRRFGPRPSGVEQHRRVQGKVEGFAHRLALDRVLAQRRAPRRLRPRVAIVGGGLAGLMAGFALSGSCDVTIFEARDRIGGRVLTEYDRRSGRVIEAGAELIGFIHPIWLILARSFNLGLTVVTPDSNFAALNLEMPLVLGGRRLSTADAKTTYDEMDGILARMCREAGRLKHNVYEPWSAPGAARLDNQPLSSWIAQQDCSPLTKVALEVEFSNTNGSATARQSYLGNLSLIAGGAMHGEPDDFFKQSESLRCDQGNQTLATKLAEAIGAAGGAVKTSSPVRHIDIKHDSVAVVPLRGETFEADHVILAIPPNLWPNGPAPTLTINPAIDAQYHMSMGTVVKYLSKVRERFWLASGCSPAGASDAFGMTWDGTDNQTQLDGQCVELTMFAGGPAAAAALDIARTRGIDALHDFYAKRIEALYPNYRKNRLGKPRFIGWTHDRWGAGYSSPAPGEVTRIGPFLAAPFHRRMHFAGEHVCLPFFGYMEGALQSGLMSALAVMRQEALI